MLTPVACVEPSLAFDSALEKMQEGGLSYLVIARDGEPLGILTNQDVLSLSAGGLASSALPVEELMTSPVETADLEEHLDKAIEIFRSRGINHLPVTDRRGHVVGMLTPRSLLLALAD